MWLNLQKKWIFKSLIIFITIYVVGCVSFFSDLKTAQAVNNSTASGSDKRILLEAAHGQGNDCNHAKAVVNGITYYENEEARIMIDKIAGYLKEANIPYEISNEIAGDRYFNNFDVYKSSNCNPEGADCCGFVQGTIGTYSSYTYNHIDQVGADKYLFALELHFNAGGGNYSLVMVKEEREPYLTNGKKITDAVDSVIGTTNSSVRLDSSALVGTGIGSLGTINNLDRSSRNIPVYYLETLFMDNAEHMNKYVNSKDALAQAIAQALVELAGSDAILSGSPNNDDDDEEKDHWSGGSLVDPYQFPTILSSQNFNCKTVLVNNYTGQLNGLGQFLKDLFTILKWGGPTLAIVLSILDFIKALTDSNPKEAQKKALNRTVKRLIIGLIILLLPFILEFLFDIFGLYDISTCELM